MTKSLNVWLMDDDDAYILLFETALETALEGIMRYTFCGFEDSKEAMKILLSDKQDNRDSTSPHLIFIDYRMPKKDGWEILQELKSNTDTQCIPVCMLSSSANPKELRQCYSLGANACLTKPLGYMELAPKFKLTCQFFAEAAEFPL